LRNVDKVFPFIKYRIVANVIRPVQDKDLSLIPVSVAIIGVFLSLFLGSIVRNGEREVVRTSFRTNYEKERSAIRAKLSSYREALMSLALFMEASELATFVDFNRSSTVVMNRNPEIKAIMWLPRVDHADRAVYEQERRFRTPGFTLREEINNSDVISTADTREEYFPIEYITPKNESNSKMIGIDIAFSRMNFESMNAAIGNLEPIVVLDPEAKQSERKKIFQFYPVYESIHASQEPEPQYVNIRGFVGASFDIESFLTTVNRDSKSTDLFFCLLDKQGDKINPLYATSLDPLNVIDESYKPAIAPINVYGRDLELVGKPTKFYVDALSNGTPLLVTTSSLIITILLSAYMQSLVNRNKAINEKVRVQTAELVNVNQQLEFLSSTDPLTGVMNRRALNSALDKEWKRSLRDGSYLSMAMLDIDFFKQYNDTYGHILGDQALQNVAATIKQHCKRSVDVVARYGGEEFVIILPGVKQPDEMLDSMIKSVQNLLIPHKSSPIGNYLTVSIGAVSCIPVDGLALESFIAEVDRQLYAAKDQGRNRFKTTPYQVST